MFASAVATVKDFRYNSPPSISRKSLPMLEEVCRNNFIHMNNLIINAFLLSYMLLKVDVVTWATVIVNGMLD